VRKKVPAAKVAAAATKKARITKKVKAPAAKAAVVAIRKAKVAVAKRKTLKVPAAKGLAAVPFNT
jgi:hypothetical protein